MLKIKSSEFGEGTERFNFPNDREPTDKELEHTGATDTWYREKGPWFTACYLVYSSIKVNDSFDITNINSQLRSIFRELGGTEGHEYARQAHVWYMQKTHTAPYGLTQMIPPKE